MTSAIPQLPDTDPSSCVLGAYQTAVGDSSFDTPESLRRCWLWEEGRGLCSSAAHGWRKVAGPLMLWWCKSTSTTMTGNLIAPAWTHRSMTRINTHVLCTDQNAFRAIQVRSICRSSYLKAARPVGCTLHSPTDSIWTPHGLHKSTWTPSRIDFNLQFYLKSIWTPPGLHLESTWNPSGLQMELIHGLCLV